MISQLELYNAVMSNFRRDTLDSIAEKLKEYQPDCFLMKLDDGIMWDFIKDQVVVREDRIEELEQTGEIKLKDWGKKDDKDPDTGEYYN